MVCAAGCAGEVEEPGGEGFVCLCEEVISVKKGRTKDIDIPKNEDF